MKHLLAEAQVTMMESNSSNAPSAPAGGHRWRFVRIGGFDHVFLEKGSDLANLDQLDQKLWAALSCPTSGLEFDAKTLQYLDIDEDGRIRAPELIAAVKWAVAMLKNPDDLVPGAAELPLASINDSTPEGRDILASARAILSNLGKDSSTVITLDDTADSARIFVDTAFNGDGVITPKSAGDDATRSVIEDIMACAGSTPDRSGAPGISAEIVDRFFDDARQFSEWHKEAEENAAAILPLGDQTAQCAEIVRALHAKTDDYFARCALAAFDSRAADALSPATPQYEELTRKELSASDEEIAAFPLAGIQPRDCLPLTEGINPAWMPLIARLREDVVRPLLGAKKEMNAAEWKVICNRFAAYDAWVTGKRGAAVENLGLARVREILAGPAREAVAKLIQHDMDVEAAANAIMDVDKLIHYRRDLFTLLNNFVSFRDFYTPGKKAIFQAGTLYLDGRSCDLCIRVDDPAAHMTLAGLGRTYLAYCECRRKDSSEKLNIAAAFTQTRK